MITSSVKELIYIKVRLNISPIHQEFRGYRFVVAHPNLCGKPSKSGSPRPSWLKPYFIFSTGDFPRITPLIYHQFIAKLQGQGYRRIELWSDLEPEPWIKSGIKDLPK